MRRRVPFFLAACVYTSTLTAPAFGQIGGQQVGGVPGPDAVYLNDGNVIRGTVTEVVVGDHVTIQLQNGQTARIVWSYVARIARDGAPPSMGTPPASPALAPAAPAPSLGSATVFIEGANVTLEQLHGSKWVRVCNSPCGKSLSLDSTYQITGDGIRSSRGFSLRGNAGERVVLDVAPASSGSYVAGIVLLSVGIPTLLIGPYVLAVAKAVGTGSRSDTTAGQATGWAMLGAGALGTVMGLILFFGNGHTGVDQRVDSVGAKAADTGKRLPIWNEWASVKPSVVPGSTPFLFPLLEQRF
ncbi:hypothetical protein LVJ94_07670 [Pendulispora rubella]|uniref:Uncharacterized protein n=1 Tax=Pendulispora rubella TaxID=2741070 RepID=A0ABZ2LBD8_9BACT